MKLIPMIVAAATLVGSGAAFAQAKEQFFPLLVYRTGPYAPNGTPWANGKQDYLKMINARDGGINGVKLTYEECETGYATDKGVECYERLKGKGASMIDPQSTGITFALTEKAPGDKIPLMTLGYGLAVIGSLLAMAGVADGSFRLVDLETAAYQLAAPERAGQSAALAASRSAT